MQLITDYQNEFVAFMQEHLKEREPKNLYDPIHYILNVGGKRLRPTLTMLSADIFGTDYHKALYAALAVEIFHNFSLVHDDIMDAAAYILQYIAGRFFDENYDEIYDDYVEEESWV